MSEQDSGKKGKSVSDLSLDEIETDAKAVDTLS